MSRHEADLPTVELSQQWTDASKHALNSYLEANNAILAAMGIGTPASESGGGRLDAPVTELSYGADAWSMERSTDDFEELGIGDYVRFSKPLLDGDVASFARASGDTNRLHLEDAFADETRFQGRIVHGTLVAGTISAALARLPGLTIYLSQDLEFRGPVRVGEVVTAECEIVEDLGESRYRLQTAVYGEDEEAVIEGEAVVLIDPLPDAGEAAAD